MVHLRAGFSDKETLTALLSAGKSLFNKQLSCFRTSDFERHGAVCNGDIKQHKGGDNK